MGMDGVVVPLKSHVIEYADGEG